MADGARWLESAPRWVTAIERRYVEAGITGTRPDPLAIVTSDELAIASAAAGAIASRFLAVGTPRSIGLIGDAFPCAVSLAAHRVWFHPTDVRCHGDVVGGGRAVSLDEALAADIVCIHVPLAIAAHQIRRGTHVNALALGDDPSRCAVTIPPELASVATVVHEHADLPAIVAGLRDGRQLDEITIFLLDGAELGARELAHD
jgi:hypothetical protein